jgi:hypothetical protein
MEAERRLQRLGLARLLGELKGRGRVPEGAVSVTASQPNPSPDKLASKLQEVP